MPFTEKWVKLEIILRERSQIQRGKYILSVAEHFPPSSVWLEMGATVITYANLPRFGPLIIPHEKDG